MTLLWAASTSEAADLCLEEITPARWMVQSNEDAQKIGAYLVRLRQCETGRPDIQEAADALSVKFIMSLERIPIDDGTRRLAAFIEKVLLTTATAGDASAQHNYATLHWANPKGHVAQMVRQDEKIFLHWTRKAAAQQEPRAMFNLAIRMMSENPPPGVKRDDITAYFLLRLAQDAVEENVEQQIFGPHLKEALLTLRDRFGREKILELEDRLYDFDTSAVAPDSDESLGSQ